MNDLDLGNHFDQFHTELQRVEAALLAVALALSTQPGGPPIDITVDNEVRRRLKQHGMLK